MFRLKALLSHIVWGLLIALVLYWWLGLVPQQTFNAELLLSSGLTAIVLHGLVYLIIMQLPFILDSYHYTGDNQPPRIGALKIAYGILNMVGPFVVGMAINLPAAIVSAAVAGVLAYIFTAWLDPDGRSDSSAWLLATLAAIAIGVATLTMGGTALGNALLSATIIVVAANFLGFLVVSVLTQYSNSTNAVKPLGVVIGLIAAIWVVVISFLA